MFSIDIGFWSSMELKRTGLTFIRKGRLRSSSYSSHCHLPSHLSLLQSSRAVANAIRSCSNWEYQMFSFNGSSEMVTVSIGRAPCFGGKEQSIIWELAISSPEKMTFFSVNDFRSAICSHKSLWAFCLLYFHQICEGTSKAKLAKVRSFQDAGTFVLSWERYLTK